MTKTEILEIENNHDFFEALKSSQYYNLDWKKLDEEFKNRLDKIFYWQNEDPDIIYDPNKRKPNTP